jgi:hypothetical protein
MFIPYSTYPLHFVRRFIIRITILIAVGGFDNTARDEG